VLCVLVASVSIALGERKSRFTHPTNGGGHAGHAFRICRGDIVKFCPDFHPTTSKEMFESECFKTHEQELSTPCKNAMEEFRKNDGGASPPESSSSSTSAGGGTSGSAAGTSLYEACKVDQLRVCPALADPWTEKDLFESACFTNNLNSISTACKTLFEKFNLNRHVLLGIILSEGVLVVGAGWLSLFALCCCVACCVRICRKRRQCRARCNKQEDTELEQTKSVNYEHLQQEEAALPQTQFVFPSQQYPPQAAFSPYPAYPAYPQPVFTAPTEQQ